MDKLKSKGSKEEFARFFESPSRESLRNLLKNQTGEYDDLDFKATLLSPDDTAKHIIGMANKSGGVIVFGVEQKESNIFYSKGLQKLEDKTDFQKKLAKYIPANLTYLVIDFSFMESEYPDLKGKSFRVILVEYNPMYIPYLPLKDSEIIKTNHVYIRHNVSTVIANYEQLQDILNRRIETGFSSSRELSFREHLSQLQDLYSVIPKTYQVSFFDTMQRIITGATGELKKNPDYPEESLEDFVKKLIALEKEIILSLIRGKSS